MFYVSSIWQSFVFVAQPLPSIFFFRLVVLCFHYFFFHFISSRPQVFCKRAVQKNFAKFTENFLPHLFVSTVTSLVLKLSWQKNFMADVFLWILLIFQNSEDPIHETPADEYFYNIHCLNDRQKKSWDFFQRI